jgi:hypothetical protein
MLSAKTAVGLAVPAVLTLCALVLTGCSKTDSSLIGTFRTGERVQVGPVIYQVLESDWRNELGPGGRAPKDRFLFVRLSITNSSASPVSIPGLTIEASGKSYDEVTDGMDKVDNWLGLLRNVQGSQTAQGWIVFEAPMAAYKLVVTDGGEVGAEKHAHIEIPVHLE